MSGQKGDRGAESEGERVSWSEEKYGDWSAGREGCLGILGVLSPKVDRGA
jgi:hypothetical protein